METTGRILLIFNTHPTSGRGPMKIRITTTDKEGQWDGRTIEGKDPVGETPNTQHALRMAFCELQTIAWGKVSKVKVSIINE